MSTATKKPRTAAWSERLLEMHDETNKPEPYPVTDDIIVMPLTRTRGAALKAAELKKFFAQQVLSRRAAVTVISQPPQLPDDATAEQTAEYEEALKDWTAAFDIEAIQRQIDAADREYDQAFFGDAHDAVMEFFEDKPALWDKFIVDIKAALLPPGPDSGTCPTCGHTDDEQAGKARTSSTSSTTTGT